MKADGFVVAQGSKASPLCALPQVCYSPALLQEAYDFPTGKRAPTGAGQTILIVVPVGSSTIAADLATFDSEFNIPPPPSFSIVPGTSVGGVETGDPVSWGVEASVSVEYAHALAPGANIVLAVSPTDDVADIVATEGQILPQYPGAIVSQSFGDDETDPSAQDAFLQLHDIFSAATSLGGTILASAGDFGAADCPDPSFGCGSVAVASYPASDPLVTGVGGTEGNPYPGGLLGGHRYGGEQVWNESSTVGLVTGGAPSINYPVAPAYQQGVTGNSARTVPDVAYNAAINGGIRIYDSECRRLQHLRRNECRAPAVGRDHRARERGEGKCRAGPAWSSQHGSLRARTRPRRLQGGFPRHHCRDERPHDVRRIAHVPRLQRRPRL